MACLVFLNGWQKGFSQKTKKRELWTKKFKETTLKSLTQDSTIDELVTTITAKKRKRYHTVIDLNIFEHDSSLIAFCDGSVLFPGKTNAQAAWACIFPCHREWDCGGRMTGQQTIIKTEFMAAKEAINCANQIDPTYQQTLYIYTDCMTLINSMLHSNSDEPNDRHVRTNNKYVKNAALIQEVLKIQRKRPIEWRHIKAHTEATDWASFWNKKADQAAKGFSKLPVSTENMMCSIS